MSFIEQAGLSVDQIKNELSNDQAILIDVREAEEVELGHLENAKWIALSALSENPDQYLKAINSEYSNKKVYVYCKSGGRSGQASQFFQSQGIKAFNIGGFQELISDFDYTSGSMENKKIS
mgnify:CR=1 FL=1